MITEKISPTFLLDIANEILLLNGTKEQIIDTVEGHINSLNDFKISTINETELVKIDSNIESLNNLLTSIK